MTPTDETQRRLDLVRSATAGRLDDLPCPKCGQLRVSVKFTQPQSGEYRTWFICTDCGFQMRTQNSERPAHF